jgi:type IV pilus assembly protein PilM
MAQRIVGLDIGTSAVRAVELAVSEGAHPVLEAYGQVGLPIGAVIDGEIQNHAAVTDAIQRLWRDGGFKSKRVVVGIAGLRAITRELDMPVLPDNELDDAVKFQADEIVPFPMERTAISSKVIARYTASDGSPTLRVLVAAAHRDLIDSVVSIVHAAGLEPVGIDLNTAALVRALCDPGLSEAPEAIVSVGAGLTLVVVHQGGVLQFVRTIDLGGETMTRAISSALDLPLIDGEAAKRRLGTEEYSDERARSAANRSIDELASEVQNSIRFFSSLPGRAPVARVLVTGGGAQVGGFIESLQERLEMPVSFAEPLSMIDMSRLPLSPEQTESITPTLAVPVGLALSEPSNNSFNLLPAEVVTKAKEHRVRQVALLGAASLVVLLVGLSVWRVLAVNQAKSESTSLHTSIRVIQTVEIPKYDKVVALQDRVRALERQAVPAVSQEVDWLVVLNQISQYQPTNAVLSGLSLTATPPPPPVQSTPTTGTSTSSTATTASSVSTTPITGPRAIIGTVNATVTVPNLQAVTTWGLLMSSAPGLTNVIPTTTLADSPTGVTFTASMQINGNDHTQRLDEFERPVP